MRLLNTSTLQVESFIQYVPLYTILSHTWGEAEVTFDDINKPHAPQMRGYKKIEQCCRISKERGYKYCWIDTCCIDKRSSAELSEAINSMYGYYRDADVCFAYLEDVPWDDNPGAHNSRFQRSRWFTRGWTLQELIVPKYLEFYDLDWAFIGTKHELVSLCSHITNVDATVLLDPLKAEKFSIAQKFSWVSRRTTTRKEDIAYCMMGIFRVHMPLLYGEGERAFVRLQEEIVKSTTDQTFLCWSYPPELEGLSADGPFCKSPLGFYKCQNLAQQLVGSLHAPYFSFTNKGLEIHLRCIQYTGRHKSKGFPVNGDQIMILPHVRDEKHPEITIGVLLQRYPGHPNIFFRMASSVERLDLRNVNIKTSLQTIYIAHTDPRSGTTAPEGRQLPWKITLSKLYCSGPEVGVKSIMYCRWGQQQDIYGSLSAIKSVDVTLASSQALALLLVAAGSGYLVTMGMTDKRNFWLHTEMFPEISATGLDGDYPRIYGVLQSRRTFVDPACVVESDVSTHPLQGGFLITAYMRRNASNSSNEPHWDLELYIGTSKCLVAKARHTYNVLYDGKAGGISRPDSLAAN